MSNSKHKTIRILIVEPGKAPSPASIPAGLESLQHHVGGLIQALYQCRYCGMKKGTYTGDLPRGQCPARKKPKVGLAPHSWMRIG